MSDTPVIPIEAIKPDLSGFGKYLYSLMLSRGVKPFSALASAPDCDEYRVHRQTVTMVAKGEQPIKPSLRRGQLKF